MLVDEALWQTVLGEIELTVSRAAYAAWFKKTSLVETSPDGAVVVGVPNIFTKQQLESRFDEQIRGILTKNGVVVSSVAYNITSDRDVKKTTKARKTISS